MSYRILIVDDEPDLEMLLMQKFRSKIRSGEFVFDFVENGQKALDKLANDLDIDIILSDINMPQMDGLTLLDKIKAQNFTQKTVMISAYGDMDNIRIAMNRGAFDFIVKPIDFGDLETTLNKAIVETIKDKEANETKRHLEKERKEKEEIILNQNHILEQKVEERTQQLLAEKKKSDDLLLNILPEEIAEELKQNGASEARLYENVSVLFTDFISFTQTAEKLSPKELVAELHECFSAFDEIIERNNLEKIKTIGDAYMAVSGMPVLNGQHAKNAVRAALEIRDFIEERRKNERVFEIRIGISSGPVVAGIVGVKKFAFDIWGDTVNTASRMESSGESGEVNLSQSTYELIKNEQQFECEYRGKIEAKGKGAVDMYFVRQSKSASE